MSGVIWLLVAVVGIGFIVAGWRAKALILPGRALLVFIGLLLIVAAVVPQADAIFGYAGHVTIQ